MKTLATAANKFPFALNGARIRRARHLTGLSQEAFAPLIGTSRRHMIRLERGQHLPGGPLRDRIVDFTQTEEQILSADDDEEADPLSLDDFLRLHIHRLFLEERANQEVST